MKIEIKIETDNDKKMSIQMDALKDIFNEVSDKIIKEFKDDKG